MKLFGSSGIRGIVNQTLTPQLVLQIGQAVGTLKENVVVGWDPRVSHPLLYHALVSGLLSTGCRVATAGMLPTPTLAYAARDFDCGVMLTASHNPAEYNGVKLWNPDGMAFDTQQQREVEGLIESGNFKRAGWMHTGNHSYRGDAIRAHSEYILGRVKPCELTVVVDCGCGAAGVITPYVLREMGCRVITLNSQPDGFFPARNPEPVEENLEELKQTVKAVGADLGIAHDGDADRMMAVDDEGDYVSGDKLLALFGKIEAEKSMVAPVDASMAVEEAIKPARLIRCRVGDVYVAEALKHSSADFGGEASGSWIFPKVSYCPDGIYAAARLVEIAAEQPLKELLEDLPTYRTLRSSLRAQTPHETVEKAARDILESGDFEITEVDTLDGFRIVTPQGWALLRPSGTEPKIRITVEVREGDAGEMLRRIEETVKKHLR
jgi:phosphoglucosamine mutase